MKSKVLSWWSRRSFWTKLILTYIFLLFVIGNILFLKNYIETLQTEKQIYCGTFDVDWECSLAENYANTIWIVYMMPLMYLLFGALTDISRLIIGLRDTTINTLLAEWPHWLFYSIPMVIFWHYLKPKRRKTIPGKLFVGVSAILLCIIITQYALGVAKYHNAVYAGTCMIVSGADRSSLHLIPPNQGTGGTYTSIPSAPAGDIDSSYSFDKDKVFHRCQIIEGADPDSFEPLHPFYSKDADSVFYGTSTLLNADVNSFRVLSHGWALDGRTVYLDGLTYPKADAQSFRQIDRDYYGDKNNVYFYEKIIEGANINTFQLLEHGYSSDANYVYYGRTRVEDADPRTFQFVEPIRFNITKDKDGVFVGGNVLRDTDPTTFVLWKDNYFRDKNHHYYIDFQVANQIDTSLDIESFEILSPYYAKDKNNVYYQGLVLREADLDSFVATSGAGGEDKNNKFHLGKITEQKK
jgi:DKNYY family